MPVRDASMVESAIKEKIAGEITLSNEPGATIRKWREIFEVSQTQLANQLDVSPSVLSDYESGRRRSPGIATIRKIIDGIIELDKTTGGKIIAKYTSMMNPGEGILSIAEYPKSVPGLEFAKAIDGKVMVAESHLAERRIQGYTLIDAVRAIASLSASDYVRVYGWSTERALVFSGIKYGRSPMVAIRVHPMKPAVVVYHRPEEVDKLAFKLAEYESIPLIVTNLELGELEKRLKAFS
jgi:putative transcriptional regulator